MIDVAHDRNHRRAGRALALDLERLLQCLLDRVFVDELDLVAHFLHDQRRHILIDHLVDRCHDAKAHQRLDHFAGFDRHPLGQFSHGDGVRHFHFPGNELRGLELAAMLFNLDRRRPGPAPPSALRLERQFAAHVPAISERGAPGTLPVLALAALAGLFAGLGPGLRLGSSGGCFRFRVLGLFSKALLFPSLLLGGLPGGLFLCGLAFGFLPCGFLFPPPGFFRLAFGFRPPGLLFGLLPGKLFLANAARFHFRLRRLPLTRWFRFDCHGLRPLDIGTLATHLHGNVAPGPALARLQRTNRLLLERDLPRRRYRGAMALLQVDEQRLFLVFGNRLTIAGVRQTRIGHLPQQAVDRCSHRFRKLSYRHIRHANFSGTARSLPPRV